jgi:mono/diheme cytochrome c family protein
VELGEQADIELRREAAGVTDVKVTTEVLYGNPARAIVDAAAANGADLIVMGTHGHGAAMHLVVGNVAERVVRTAPCPVVTVRQPSVREEKEGTVKKLAIAGAAALAAVLLLPAVASAQAEQPQQFKQVTTGAEVYRTYCATCHGTSGRGDGPLASSMNRKPANLLEIAKRNGGVFPAEMVFKTIDGRTPVRGHGGPDMPVWGEAFQKSREAGDQQRVNSVIQSLVDYIDSIQVRPSHDQQP